MAAPGRRVTIKDVAAYCGVSTQTVSRVMNNRPDVAPATRRKVEQAIADLGYTPSALARTLVARRSDTIGVLLAGMAYVGTIQTLTGIVDESARLGLTVLIAELPEVHTDPKPGISALIEHHVDGIIMSVPDVGGAVDRIGAALSNSPEPVVFVKAGVSDRYSSVLVDNAAAVQQVVDHLADTGRSRIVHISGPLSWHEARDRRDGWLRGLENHGFTHDPGYLAEGDWSPESGADAMVALLGRVPDLDAVVVANDRMALGAMYELRSKGLRIPDDVAVCGFDDISEAAWFAPPLTSVRQPLAAMGRQAVRTLLSHVRDAGVSVHTVPLQAELVVRESTVGPS